jgi:adenosylcobinamide kinase/adenosylcobinamide-phosphate guanylyltransferase
VDCLTLWLNNVIADEERFQRERAALVQALPELSGRIILVSNEVGMGVVPLGEATRRFCDEAGRLHQELARLCDRVTLVAAGLPLLLKGKETT